MIRLETAMHHTAIWKYTSGLSAHRARRPKWLLTNIIYEEGLFDRQHVFSRRVLQSLREVITAGTPAVEGSFYELTARLRFYS